MSRLLAEEIQIIMVRLTSEFNIFKKKNPKPNFYTLARIETIHLDVGISPM